MMVSSGHSIICHLRSWRPLIFLEKRNNHFEICFILPLLPVTIRRFSALFSHIAHRFRPPFYLGRNEPLKVFNFKILSYYVTLTNVALGNYVWGRNSQLKLLRLPPLELQLIKDFRSKTQNQQSLNPVIRNLSGQCRTYIILGKCHINNCFITLSMNTVHIEHFRNI